MKLDRITPVEGSPGFHRKPRIRFYGWTGALPVRWRALGTYSLITSDPVTGAFARGIAAVSGADQVVDVLLVEGARGEVNGYVIDSYGAKFSPGGDGSNIVLGWADSERHHHDRTGWTILISGIASGWLFAGGDRPCPRNQGRRGTSGSVSGALDAASLVASVNIQLQPSVSWGERGQIRWDDAGHKCDGTPGCGTAGHG